MAAIVAPALAQIGTNSVEPIALATKNDSLTEKKTKKKIPLHFITELHRKRFLNQILMALKNVIYNIYIKIGNIWNKKTFKIFFIFLLTMFSLLYKFLI
jgi:hypothetical protein